MRNGEELEQLKENIAKLSLCIQDGTFNGVSKSAVIGIRYALKEILQDTGLTLEELQKEYAHDQ